VLRAQREWRVAEAIRRSIALVAAERKRVHQPADEPTHE
jgi:hypothetical protein